MSEKQRKVHWAQRVALVGLLACLFLISAAIEPPAEESCCPEGEGLLSYYLQVTPERWDPAPWGASNQITARLLEAKNDTPVTATFHTGEVPADSAITWTTSATDNVLAWNINLQIKARAALPAEYVKRVQYTYSLGRGTFVVGTYNNLLTTIQNGRVHSAVNCLVSRAGSSILQLSAVKDGRRYSGASSIRPPLEDLVTP